MALCIQQMRTADTEGDSGRGLCAFGGLCVDM